MRISDVFTRCRRFLRDPDGDIWTDADLLEYWNDVQRELCVTVPNLAEYFTILDYPPEWDYSYQHDWERGQVSTLLYQACELWDLTGKVICHVWEPWYPSDTAPTSADGYRCTHPWEGLAYTPGHILPMPLPDRCDRIRMITYDEEVLTPLTRQEVSGSDPWFHTASGTAQNYWKPDDFSNSIVIYPRPSNVVWTTTNAPGVGTAAIGETFVIGGWPDPGDANVSIMCSRIAREYTTTDGLISDWPEWAIKYLECGLLYRAFGADNDGFIPSLRDYWKFRWKMGFMVLKKWQSRRLQDRKIQIGRMGGRRHTGRKPWPRLPSKYPDIQP